MSPECLEWGQVLDAEVTGQEVPADVRERAARHEQSCPKCKAEREVWRGLACLSDTRADAGFVDRVLGSFEGTQRRVIRWRVWGAAAGALAAAAASAVWLHRPSITPAPTAALALAELVTASGDVRVDGSPAKLDSPLRASSVVTTGDDARACFAVDPGVRACLGANAQASVADLVLAQRRIALQRGRITVSLEPQPEHTSFSVSTQEGTVTAVGTQFTVDTQDGTVARVLHGVVRVQTSHGDQRLGAHERIDLVSGARSSASAAEEEADQGLLDGVPVTPPPPAPTESTAPPVATSATAIVAPTEPPPLSAAELLRSARVLRGDRKLSEAAQTYRRLQTLYPDSAEAHASYVSLGELELGGLGDPEGALRAFDAYLRSPGSSTRDARYGRIQALHALHRSDEERQAITAFVADYPSSEEASELRGRLK